MLKRTSLLQFSQHRRCINKTTKGIKIKPQFFITELCKTWPTQFGFHGNELSPMNHIQPPAFQPSNRRGGPDHYPSPVQGRTRRHLEVTTGNVATATQWSLVRLPYTAIHQACFLEHHLLQVICLNRIYDYFSIIMDTSTKDQLILINL